MSVNEQLVKMTHQKGKHKCATTLWKDTVASYRTLKNTTGKPTQIGEAASKAIIVMEAFSNISYTVEGVVYRGATHGTFLRQATQLLGGECAYFSYATFMKASNVPHQHIQVPIQPPLTSQRDPSPSRSTVVIPRKTISVLNFKRYAWCHSLKKATSHALASLFLHAHNINLKNPREIPLPYIEKKHNVNKDKKHFFFKPTLTNLEIAPQIVENINQSLQSCGH